MRQPDKPVSAFEAFFKTAGIDYSQRAVGMVRQPLATLEGMVTQLKAQNLDLASLEPGKLGPAAELLLQAQKTDILGANVEAVVAKIHDKITGRGFPIPDARRLAVFLPDETVQAEQKSGESPQHPLRSLVGLIGDELQEQILGLVNRGHDLEIAGKGDEADEVFKERQKLRQKKERGVDSLVVEVIKIAEQSGYGDLSDEQLVRTAIMLQEEEAQAQKKNLDKSGADQEQILEPVKKNLKKPATVRIPAQ